MFAPGPGIKEGELYGSELTQNGRPMTLPYSAGNRGCADAWDLRGGGCDWPLQGGAMRHPQADLKCNWCQSGCSMKIESETMVRSSDSPANHAFTAGSAVSFSQAAANVAYEPG